MTEEKLQQLEDDAVRHLEKSVSKIKFIYTEKLNTNLNNWEFNRLIISAIKDLPYALVYGLNLLTTQILQGKEPGE